MRVLKGLLLKPALNLLTWILRRNGNSIIIGGPLGWTWESTLDTTHHGALAGPADAHRHSDLASIGTDDHHTRDHATRHQDGEADEVNLDLTQIGTGWDKQSFINLLENGDFEVGDPPVGWLAIRANLAREATIVKKGSYSFKVTATGAGNSCGYQLVPNYAEYAGRKITLGAWLYAPGTNVGTDVRLRIRTDIDSAWGLAVTKDDDWHWTTLTFTVPSGITFMEAWAPGVYISGDIGYADGAILVEGEVCPAFSPRPPRYKEQDASEIINGRFGMARMPDMDLNKVMVGQGVGNDPIEADLPPSEDSYARILTWLGV